MTTTETTESTRSSPTQADDRFINRHASLMPTFAALGVLVVLLIVAQLYFGDFVSPGNMSALLLDNAYLMVIAVGMTFVILSGAQHPIAAHLWIDFNLDAQISAQNTNYIGYMGPNAAAKEFISPDILADPTVNPDIALLDKLVELLQLGADLDKYTQRWNALKA